jgi:hypothetical protein
VLRDLRHYFATLLIYGAANVETVLGCTDAVPAGVA